MSDMTRPRKSAITDRRPTNADARSARLTCPLDRERVGTPGDNEIHRGECAHAEPYRDHLDSPEEALLLGREHFARAEKLEEDVTAAEHRGPDEDAERRHRANTVWPEDPYGDGEQDREEGGVESGAQPRPPAIRLDRAIRGEIHWDV